MQLELVGIFLSYLMGSIPFGLVVTHFLGTVDPRSSGSQNIGFTNVLRVCGKKAGYLTLAGDMGKGLAIVFLVKALGFSWTGILLCGFMVTVGHIFSIFLSFKGGKGVATALGAILGIHVWLGIGLLVIWLAAVAALKFSSGGALTAFAIFPVSVYLFAYDSYFLIFSISISVLIFFCHRDNISRIIEGKEGKINLSS